MGPLPNSDKLFATQHAIDLFRGPRASGSEVAPKARGSKFTGEDAVDALTGC